jgi:hypothetical protein
MESLLSRIGWPEDDLALLLLHAVVGLTLFVSVLFYVRARLRERGGEVKEEVIRGDNSMGQLAAAYATVVIAIDASAAGSPYKTGLIIADAVAIAYLFFFSRWFRNRVIRAISARKIE